ncbi:MAG: bifunctional oligoribonuclease/PAP phosphatase NrnA [Clostridiales bacterium]|nr:bifunctional oligoribonuclease/PAP phosphatase NrnA [Clostridiales bacterium]
MKIELPEVVKLLKEHDNFLILCHSHPDGDTLGCGFALARALRSMGKKANVKCEDNIPRKFSASCEIIEEQDFEPEYIVSVDVADTKLLGENVQREYGDKINLAIDHHSKNADFADYLYVDASAAAACEIIYQIVCELGVVITKDIADCIFTGLSTDSGCFRYSNTTPRTHYFAAKVMECGADAAKINRIMFETKTKEYAILERMVLESLKLYCDNKLAIIAITQDMYKTSGCSEDECDGIASLPRQIEGVLAGVTIKEKKDGKFKISVRTYAPVDAAQICSKMGGGGHVRAAGCQLEGTLEETINTIVENVKEFLV